MSVPAIENGSFNTTSIGSMNTNETLTGRSSSRGSVGRSLSGKASLSGVSAVVLPTIRSEGGSAESAGVGEAISEVEESVNYVYNANMAES